MQMTATRNSTDTPLASASRIHSAGEAGPGAALEAARGTMDGGKAVDEHQVHAERLAYAATELQAAREMIAYAEGLRGWGSADAIAEEQALAYTAEVVHKLRSQAEGALEEFGVS